jgi:hypothetical protein
LALSGHCHAKLSEVAAADRPSAPAALRDHRPLNLSNNLPLWGVWDYLTLYGRLKTEAVMTNVQLVLVIYGAVCVGATLGYVIAGLLANAHKH